MPPQLRLTTCSECFPRFDRERCVPWMLCITLLLLQLFRFGTTLIQGIQPSLEPQLLLYFFIFLWSYPSTFLKFINCQQFSCFKKSFLKSHGLLSGFCWHLWCDDDWFAFSDWNFLCSSLPLFSLFFFLLHSPFFSVSVSVQKLPGKLCYIMYEFWRDRVSWMRSVQYVYVCLVDIGRLVGTLNFLMEMFPTSKDEQMAHLSDCKLTQRQSEAHPHTEGAP